MCLYIEDNAKIEVAAKDIKVFKLVNIHVFDGEIYVEAPYQATSYKLAEGIKTNLFSCGMYDSYGYRVRKFSSHIPEGALVVNHGIHSCVTYDGAAAKTQTHRLVVHAIIPKGTKFIRGEYGEIVSLRLMFGRAAKTPLDFKHDKKYADRKRRYNKALRDARKDG